MSPPSTDRAITFIRRDIPEFESRFLDLLQLYGEELTPEAVFMELADFVSELLVTCGSPGTLDRCFSVVDEVADVVPGGVELIAYSFLAQMPPAIRRLAEPCLPTRMETLLMRLEDHRGGVGGGDGASRDI